MPPPFICHVLYFVYGFLCFAHRESHRPEFSTVSLHSQQRVCRLSVCYDQHAQLPMKSAVSSQSACCIERVYIRRSKSQSLFELCIFHELFSLFHNISLNCFDFRLNLIFFQFLWRKIIFFWVLNLFLNCFIFKNRNRDSNCGLLKNKFVFRNNSVQVLKRHLKMEFLGTFL